MIYNLKKKMGMVLSLAFMMFFVMSCEKEDVGGGDTKDDSKSITISSSAGNDFSINTESSFVVKNDKGVDVTSSSEIYVGDSKISGSKYTFVEKGTYEVYAKYKKLTSNKLSIVVKSPISTTNKTEFTSKVLAHDFTGTWCGFCAATLLGLHAQEAKFPGKLIPIEVHAGGSGSGGSGADVFDFPNAAPFDVNAYPSLWYNFDRNYEYFADADIATYVSKKIKTGLSINYDTDGGKVTVKVKSDTMLNGRKLAVYVVEGGLKADQANYDNDNPSSPAYQKGAVIKDFDYHNVARATLSESPLGDVISSAQDNELVKEFKLEGLSSKVKDMKNTKIVAVLLDGAGKYINAQSAVANENKDFD